jgi:hypothetical protein
MKEHPILMAPQMAAAVANGTKTQTRRVAKGTALEWLKNGLCPVFVADPANDLCPYGRVGDRLWVRERWGVVESCFNPRACTVRYAADDSTKRIVGETGAQYAGPALSFRWRPSIHMPRWACRTIREITATRLERLRSISAQDIRLEGLEEMIQALYVKHSVVWEPQCWINGDDEGLSYCRKCADEKIKALQKEGKETEFTIGGGYYGASIETQGFDYCETCGKLLECSPLNPDEYFPDEDGNYFDTPMRDEEVAMLADMQGRFGVNDQINREVFRASWDSLAKPGERWADNPLVWVVEFKRVDGAA